MKIPCLHRLLGGLLFSLLLAGAPTAFAADCPRIVSQSPYLTLALEWLERGDCLVGVSRYDRLRPALPRTGGVMDPDAEAIALLEPELFVTSNWTSADTVAALLPPGTRALRVDGFRSMADVEAMLRSLAEASGAPAAEAKLAAFARDWRAAAAAVGGDGRRALVISACSGLPYSFGRGHVVGDAFVHAGFDVVESAEKIRHLRPGEEIDSIAAAVERFAPEIVFSLTPESAEQCSAELGLLPVALVGLEGSGFFHPGPGLVAGLEALAEQVKR